MARKTSIVLGAFFCLFALFSTQAFAASSVNINEPNRLGHLKLSKNQLSEIKKAVVKALDAPIDAEQQCGKVRLDCVVRAAKEWKVGDDTYREIIIHIHTLGHSSISVGKINGKWPEIVAK